ncbi:hypothetical protein EUX98_g5506 [Antrodiella citrinella]|uniref:Fungal-type protein kinase domain-containing protein n=1 Tax=Antrodiella citrinella TaxID=2447956 RepID=A0A4S4MT94_9APHY|nr:hypothetical protein EUX98_g5506 [Antrodiella citrinella]
MSNSSHQSQQPDPKQKPVKYRNTPRKKDSPRQPDAELVDAHSAERRYPQMDSLPSHIPEVTMSYFLEHATPQLKKREVERVIRDVQPRIIKNGRLSEFPQDPRHMTGDEHTVFKGMERLSNTVLEAAIPIMGEPTARSYCRPRNTEKSETENGGFKSDGNQFLGLGASPGALYIVDSVTNHKYKKSDEPSEVNQNRRQMLGNAAHIMFADPARRFRFAVTIENTSMRLWFLSRTVCFVTKPFNFITEPMHYVRFLLATSFGSKEALGWDPTVSRVTTNDGKVVYEYLVEGKTYRTVGDAALFSHQAYRLLGRAIRVWRVKEVGPDGELFRDEHALKDYWLPEYCQTEGEIQAEIFEDAAKARPDDSEMKFKNYFMTILHDTVLPPSNLPPIPPTTCRQLQLIVSETKAPTVPHVKRSTNAQPTGGNVVSTPAPERGDYPSYVAGGVPVTIRYEPRKHCRLVFKEVGTPLHKIPNHINLFLCLVDALKGLKVLHDARRIYRDISTGNLLWCETGPGEYFCKISDLEYVRRYLVEMKDGEAQHSHKTGTPSFMAVEIQGGRRAFASTDVDSDSDDDDEDTDDEDGLPPLTFVVNDGGANKASVNVNGDQPNNNINWVAALPLLHNYLHDIEGVWWIAIWILFYTVPLAIALSTIDTASQLPQEAVADELFPDNLHGSSQRTLFFTTFGAIEENINLLPQNYQPVMLLMAKAHRRLVKMYKKIEDPAFPERIFKHDAFSSIYSKMIVIFRRAARAARERDAVFISDHRRELVAEEDKKKQEAADAEAKKRAAMRKTKVKATMKTKAKATSEDAEARVDDSDPMQLGASRGSSSPVTRATKRKRSEPDVITGPSSKRPQTRKALRVSAPTRMATRSSKKGQSSSNERTSTRRKKR